MIQPMLRECRTRSDVEIPFGGHGPGAHSILHPGKRYACTGRTGRASKLMRCAESMRRSLVLWLFLFSTVASREFDMRTQHTIMALSRWLSWHCLGCMLLHIVCGVDYVYLVHTETRQVGFSYFECMHIHPSVFEQNARLNQAADSSPSEPGGALTGWSR